MIHPDDDGTFAAALERAMRVRQMSLSDVRDRLESVGHPISLASLSYWRAGVREPARRRSLEALPDLERLLGLPGGALSERLEERRRGSRPQPFDELVGHPIDRHLRGEDDIDRIVFHLVVDVGPRREVVRARVMQVFVARRAGVDGVTVFVGPDSGSEVNDVELRALAGCTIGAVRDIERGITATRLTFDRPLRAGESAAAEYEVTTVGRLDLETEYGLVAEQTLEEAMVWVRFHPDCTPARAWVWFDEGGLRHDWPVDLAGAMGLYYRQVSFGPGTMGGRWEW